MAIPTDKCTQRQLSCVLQMCGLSRTACEHCTSKSEPLQAKPLGQGTEGGLARALMDPGCYRLSKLRDGRTSLISISGARSRQEAVGLSAHFSRNAALRTVTPRSYLTLAPECPLNGPFGWFFLQKQVLALELDGRTPHDQRPQCNPLGEPRS